MFSWGIALAVAFLGLLLLIKDRGKHDAIAIAAKVLLIIFGLSQAFLSVVQGMKVAALTAPRLLTSDQRSAIIDAFAMDNSLTVDLERCISTPVGWVPS